MVLHCKLKVGLFVLMLLYPSERKQKTLKKKKFFLFSELTFLAEWWSGLDIKLYGTKEDFDKLGKESAIILCNHRSDVDWLIGYTLADRVGVLAVRTYQHWYRCTVNQ